MDFFPWPFYLLTDEIACINEVFEVTIMADYRSFKEIKNRYMRISIPLLLLSLLTIGAGLYAIINGSPERTYHWLDIVFALG